jgi:hypothetical protein
MYYFRYSQNSSLGFDMLVEVLKKGIFSNKFTDTTHTQILVIT